MTRIIVLIRHSEKWNEKNCYIKYSIDGIVLSEYASYSDLIEDNDAPMEMCNDMDVRIYAQLKSDTLSLIETIGDNSVDVFDGVNNLIITNRNQ
ncbi:hypothetical protein H5410_046924 [Solanum commersonii]|uniref:Uncharacterized protein n=1 Tax=Solanum commersonii TaxID=4109 RepID=A0A9J5XFR6_SOLCO|nr:hypothetical protein H5410_046924 [Solanum commersonii]